MRDSASRALPRQSRDFDARLMPPRAGQTPFFDRAQRKGPKKHARCLQAIAVQHFGTAGTRHFRTIVWGYRCSPSASLESYRGTSRPLRGILSRKNPQHPESRLFYQGYQLFKLKTHDSFTKYPHLSAIIENIHLSCPFCKGGSPPFYTAEKQRSLGQRKHKPVPSGYKINAYPPSKTFEIPEPTEKERVIYAYPLIQPVFRNLPSDL